MGSPQYWHSADPPRLLRRHFGHSTGGRFAVPRGAGTVICAPHFGQETSFPICASFAVALPPHEHATVIAFEGAEISAGSSKPPATAHAFVQ